MVELTENHIASCIDEGEGGGTILVSGPWSINVGR